MNRMHFTGPDSPEGDQSTASRMRAVRSRRKATIGAIRIRRFRTVPGARPITALSGALDEEVVQKHVIQTSADAPPCSSGPALGLGIKSPSACQILNNMAKRFVDRNLLCRAAAFDLALQHLTNLSDDVFITD
jgi:hypothetical protein